jgi:hypothetical protein
MADLRSPPLLYAKAVLFLLTGSIAATLLILQAPTLSIAALLAVAIWAFCRAYYFAFYVVDHYIDPGYRFAGLGSFAAYLVRRRARRSE